MRCTTRVSCTTDVLDCYSEDTATTEWRQYVIAASPNSTQLWAVIDNWAGQASERPRTDPPLRCPCQPAEHDHQSRLSAKIHLEHRQHWQCHGRYLHGNRRDWKLVRQRDDRHHWPESAEYQPACEGDIRDPGADRHHGSQFYANFGGMKAVGMSKFQQYLIDRKINHILGRVHHPQTNGKIERFYETFQSKIQHFNSMEEFVIRYNTKRPHMSLNWDQLETPVQAFYKKIDRRRKQLLFIINNLR